MPTIKPHDYTPKQISMSLAGRAIAHPCRIKIIDLLIENPKLSNKDLSEILSLSKATIHNHIVKLWEAGFISVTYKTHLLQIEISKDQQRSYKEFERLFQLKKQKHFHLGLLD